MRSQVCPVCSTQATDPDVGEGALLVYSLSAGDRFFDVDASTGLVYVVSVAGLAGQTITVEVKAKDPRGLQATTKVEVSERGGRDRKETKQTENQSAELQNTRERATPSNRDHKILDRGNVL